eukprot:XP_764737.1 hypothetical protein [Theileria parva strain Muguga]
MVKIIENTQFVYVRDSSDYCARVCGTDSGLPVLYECCEGRDQRVHGFNVE